MNSVFWLNLGLQSFLLTLAGWAVVRWVLRDARQRAWTVVLALGTAVVVPAMMTLQPKPAVFVPATPATPATPAAPPTWRPDWTVKLEPAAITLLPLEKAAPSRSFRWMDWAPALIWSWLGGAVLLSLWHTAGTVRVLRWRSRLQPGPQPRLWTYRGPGSPCVAGLFTPVIAVPEGLSANWNEDQWRWLMAHESEHLRGCDPAIVWTLGWVRAALWWNPLVHDLVNQWSLAREEVCDAVAVAKNGNHEGYATFLVDIAAQNDGTPAIAMAASRPARRLRSRLMSLLEQRPVCDRIGPGFITGSILAIGIGAMLVSFSGVKAASGPKDSEASSKAETEDAGALITRAFRVVPDFLEKIGGGNAKSALEREGITFPDGASAVFISSTSQLIVRQTKAGLEKVEELISQIEATTPLVRLTVRVMEAPKYVDQNHAVLDDRGLDNLLKVLAQAKETNFVTSPSVVTKLGHKVVIEMGHQPPDRNDGLAGLRLDLTPILASKEKIKVDGEITIGHQAGAHGLPPSKEAEKAVARLEKPFVCSLQHGQTFVLHLIEIKKGRFITLLVSAQALLPSGAEAGSFHETIRSASHVMPATGNGIAFTVNGKVTTQKELELFIRCETRRLRFALKDQPGEDASQIEQLREHGQDIMSQREILVGQFKARSRQLAEAEVDAAVQKEIDGQFQGSRDAFISDLQRWEISVPNHRTHMAGWMMAEMMAGKSAQASPPAKEAGDAQEDARFHVMARIMEVTSNLKGEVDPLGQVFSSQVQGTGVRPDKDSASVSNAPAADAVFVSGALTEPQFQVMLRAFGQRPNAKLETLPSATVASSKPARLGAGDSVCEVIPTLGKDGYTVDLAISAPEFGEKKEASIWDGQTAFFIQPVSEDKEKNQKVMQVLFVTVKRIATAAVPPPPPQDKKE